MKAKELSEKYNTCDWLRNYGSIGLTKEHIRRLNSAINTLESLNEYTDAKYIKEIKNKLLEDISEPNIEKINTDMNYKEKYEKAISRARVFSQRWQGIEAIDSELALQELKEVFPELKDSEDEEIRKEIISFIKDNTLTYTEKGAKRQIGWISWLEKQGNDIYLTKDGTDNKENVWNNAHDFRPKHLQRCLCYDKYMGGVYCYVYDDISKYWCAQTTVMHDPDGDNHICDYADYRVTMWMSIPSRTFYSSKRQSEQEVPVQTI